MQTLADIYGYCIIPKSTLLFRGHSDTSYYDCMFFATKQWVAGAFNDSIRVWKTQTDIEIIFLVDYLTENSWTISALPKLYNSIFSADNNPDFDNLDIKHWDIDRKNKLVQELYDKYKISGWLSSLENRVELEVCLFNMQANENQLLLLDIVERKSKKYIKDSLDNIKILPSQNFYDKTNQKLAEQATILKNEKDHYKRYKGMINAWINDEVQHGMDKVEVKHYHFNLRTKLKV
ncbi:MAG: hypothetical protein RLZ10_2459 [Bacteroidota bacterium]|jgi:hypothetical protein